MNSKRNHAYFNLSDTKIVTIVIPFPNIPKTQRGIKKTISKITPASLKGRRNGVVVLATTNYV